MYALPRGGNANKLLVKTRRTGVPQTIAADNSSSSNSPGQRDSSSSDKSFSPEVFNSPKPVFHVHGKKTAIHSQKSQTGRIDPQHKELVKYINETWKCVKKEYESDGVASAASSCLTTDKSSVKSAARRPSLVTKKDFEPFDLEAFWGRRLYEKLTTN